MKKNELKTILKPLIKECIKEVILESGILSNVVAEVAKGMGGVLNETSPSVPQQRQSDQQDAIELQKNRLAEQRARLASTLSESYGGVNVFEGVEPTSAAPAPDSAPSAADPLSSYAPNDPGVNINGLLSIVGSKWKKMK